MAKKPKDLKQTNNWFTYPQFYSFIASQEFSVLVELGVWKGHSISYLADKCRHYRPTIYAIDLWDEVYSFELQGGYAKPETKDAQIPIIYDIYNQNLKDTNTRELIKDIKKCSWEAAEDFEDGSVDFVFIDADHAYESTLKDIRAWLPKIRKGGILAGHDYVEKWKGVKQAVDECFDNVNTSDGNTWWIRV
jgi:hypothetical protein